MISSASKGSEWIPLPFKGVIASALMLVGSLLSYAISIVFSVSTGIPNLDRLALSFELFFGRFGLVGMAVSSCFLLIALILICKASDSSRMRWQVCRRLYSTTQGNPLGLRDGDALPRIVCSSGENGFVVTVFAESSDVDGISRIAPCISASLHGSFSSFAVVSFEQDPAGCYVNFFVEDVSSDRSLTFSSVDEMKQGSPTSLVVQDGLSLDLTAARSLLVAGRTRAGKTTGIIALLIQVLMQGPDEFGSKIVLVDPKGAELSLVGALTFDDDGGVQSIIDALRDFDQLRKSRQSYLDQLSEDRGDAVMWWDAEMKPCYFFIDEYVALCSAIPKRKTKDGPGYSLDDFDGLVRSIATMGASAGCFLIISVAQASVGSGGISSMLLSACGTHILFRPTVDEGSFIWPRHVLDAFPARRYRPGDAWLSSDDGLHTNPCFVRFPHMTFPVYSELKRLLDEYGR